MYELTEHPTPTALPCYAVTEHCPHPCRHSFTGEPCTCDVDPSAHVVIDYCLPHSDSRCTMCQPLGFRRDMSRPVDADSTAWFEYVVIHGRRIHPRSGAEQLAFEGEMGL